MLIGNHYVSIDYLSTLIRNISKLQHGLVRFDIFPRDRQNFSSCVKICSDDVTSCLTNIDDSASIIMYLHLLRSIITTYIEKLTTTINRLYHAWFSVFVCRLWYIWIDKMAKVDLDKSLYELTGITHNRKKKRKRQFSLQTTPTIALKLMLTPTDICYFISVGEKLTTRSFEYLFIQFTGV